MSQKKDSSLFVSVYDLNNKQLRRLDPVYDGNFDFTAACFNPKLDKLAVLKRTISKKDTIKSVVIFELPKFKLVTRLFRVQLFYRKVSEA